MSQANKASRLIDSRNGYEIVFTAGSITSDRDGPRDHNRVLKGRRTQGMVTSQGVTSDQFEDISELSSVLKEDCVPKMSEFESFVAICKGYCAINILILPKNFENGGWLVGILSINIGCCFVLYCAHKLVKCGIKIN